MSFYRIVFCSASVVAMSTAAHAQVSNNDFDFNRLTSSTFYYGAELDAESNEFFIRNRYQDVATRWQPGFSPLPVRFGAFEALPTLLAGSFYTDNLFLDNQSEVSDVGLFIEPSVTVQSTWSRHQIGFDAKVNHTEFIDTSSESATTGGIRAFGGLDINSNFNISGSGFFNNQREPRTSVGGVVNAIERVESVTAGGEINSIYQRNRLKIRNRFAYTDFNFDDVELVDGSISSQDFRDYREISGAIRGDYAISRDWSVASEFEYVDRESDITAPGIIDRNVDGYAVRVGSNFELPYNLRGDVLVGYQSFSASSPGIPDVDGFSVRGNVSWFPTQLTTVTVGARRDVEDAGAVNASSVLVTGGNINISHEFRRNFVAFARGGYEEYEFEPIDTSEEQFSFGLGGTWKANRHAHFTLSYNYSDRDSVFQPFEQNRVLFSLRFFP